MSFVHGPAVNPPPPVPHHPHCSCPAHPSVATAAAPRGTGVIPMWIWPFVVGGAALSACVYTAMHDPNVEQGIFPPCPFKTFTGYDCPGCGMTRGVYALMQGNVIKMLNHNLLLLLLLPTVGYGFLRWSLASFGSDRLPKISVTPKVSYGVVLFIVAFWIVRNLPGPLSFLNATA